MDSSTRAYIAGLCAGDLIVKTALDNIAGEQSSAARIERVLLRQIRREFKAAIDVNKGKQNATL
jgi:hypothetical protein